MAVSPSSPPRSNGTSNSSNSSSNVSIIGICRLVMPFIFSFLATLTIITQHEYFRGTSSSTSSNASSSAAALLGVATTTTNSDSGDAKIDIDPNDEGLLYSLDESNVKQQDVVKPKKGDDTKISKSDSIFNCDGKLGACEYFYPTIFFNKIHGPGREYRVILETIEQLRNDNQLWLNMPRIGWPTFSFSNTVTNPQTNKPFNKQNVSFLHVHKAGGTTIHSYMIQARKLGIGVQRHYVYHWIQAKTLAAASKANAQARLKKAIESEQEKMALMYYHLSTAGKYRSSDDEWGPNDHLLFAVVRDPLDRFVSSMGQAMGASGSTNNVIGKTLMDLCDKDPKYSKENSNKVAQCIVNYIQENGYTCEVHFTPQAIEIAFATQMYHVPVAVFKFEDSYKQILTEMGANPNNKQRDGDAKGYRPSAVLKEMKSTDFEPKLVEDICNLYKVDVIMMRTLGYSVPRCDPYIPE